MLQEILVREKASIIKKWFELIIRTYPGDSSHFLSSQTDQFANPVRANLLKGLDGIYDGLINDKLDSPEVAESLDVIIRIRAIQDFTPADALVFVFFLKNAILEAVAKLIQENKSFEELLTFMSRVDRLALLAFNVYTQCRERLFEVRVAELKRQTSRILERVSRKYGAPEDWLPDDDK